MPNVTIENAIAGHGWMKLKKANQYVRRGLATWVRPGIVLRFNRDESDHRERSAQKTLAITYAEHCLRRGYDIDVATHRATLDQIRGLPCVAPEKLIRDGRERFNPRAPKCSSVRIVESRGVPLALDGRVNEAAAH